MSETAIVLLTALVVFFMSLDGTRATKQKVRDIRVFIFLLFKFKFPDGINKNYESKLRESRIVEILVIFAIFVKFSFLVEPFLRDLSFQAARL